MLSFDYGLPYDKIVIMMHQLCKGFSHYQQSWFVMYDNMGDFWNNWFKSHIQSDLWLVYSV